MVRLSRILLIGGTLVLGTLAVVAAARAVTVDVLMQSVEVPARTANFQELNIEVAIFNPTDSPQPINLEVRLSASPWLFDFGQGEWAQTAGVFRVEAQPGSQVFTLPVLIREAPVGPLDVEITLQETGQKIVKENATEVVA